MENADIVKRFKSFVETEDLSGAKNFLNGLVSDPDSCAEIAWDHVYQKVYLHACLKKRQSFVNWINQLFEMLDPIEKIALRQTFAYGRYLLNKS
jgi:glutathionyl-hydroquinone reductase